MEEPTIDYADIHTPEPWRPGIGYLLIVIVNALLLVPGSYIVIAAMGGSGAARSDAFILSELVFGMQLIFGAWPG